MNSDTQQRMVPPGINIYRFKVTLTNHTPAIWRRVEVPGDFTFAQFAKIIMRAMGWEGYHLYAFRTPFYDICDGEFDYGEPSNKKSKEVKILDEFHLTSGVQAMKFEYDFGDGWMHKIILEEVLPPVMDKLYPACTAGKNACPPEDCGGVWGYDNLLEAIKNPAHQEHKQLSAWMEGCGYGKNFDPKKFELSAVNFDH